MAVRKLEQRVPGGFDNVDALGYAVKSEDKKYALVSFLGETLRIGHIANKPKFNFVNHYVVFVDTIDANAVSNYRWNVQFFNDLGEEVIVRPTVIVDEFKEGVFKLELSPSEIDQVINNLIVEIKISVELLGTTIIGGISSVTLSLTHKVFPFRQDLEDLNLKKNTQNATVGNRKVFRWVGNHLAKYIQAAYEGESDTAKTNIPSALLAAVVYKSALDNLNKPRGVFNLSPVSARRNSKHGICNLHPAFAAMFIPKNKDLADTFFSITAQTSKQANHPAFKKYKGLSEEEQIDVYNLLRFPKSNIKVCLLSLLGAKNYYGGANKEPDFTNQSLSNSSYKNEDKKVKRCIRNIVSEISTGLHTNLFTIKTSTSIANAITKDIYNEYIKKLAFYPKPLRQTDKLPIEYKEIKVKVLDIRSGRPIRHAKTKKIVIKDKDGNEISRHNFAYNISARSVTGKSLRNETRKSLEQFGYKKNNISFNAAHDAYWNARKVNSINISAISQQYIVEDYRGLASTDEQGVLKVRIPKKITDTGAIHIELGFWEFPILLEELQDGVNRIGRAANDGKPTDFTITWTNTQTQNWDNHISGAENFGWQVSSANNSIITYPLKVAESLEVNTSSSQGYSKYYDEETNNIHFVLLGMQWCQPVWQRLPDYWIQGKWNTPNLVESVPTTVENGLASAIVTRYNTGLSENSKGVSSGFGRDYGILILNPNSYGPRGSNRRHKGTDYFAIEHESPVFSPHGGIIDEVKSSFHGTGNYSNGYGNRLRIKIFLEKTYFILLAHLSENPENIITINNTDLVYAGQKIGVAGRTFKVVNGVIKSHYDSGPTHLHLEVMKGSKNYGSVTNRIQNPQDIIKANSIHVSNRNIFLNEDNYRLFPCDGNWPAASDWNAARCAVRTDLGIAENQKLTRVSSNCWASRNLHCPYLSGIFKYQAQLTYLFEDDVNSSLTGTNKYLNPNGIDGDWGNSAKLAIERFRTKHQGEIWPSGVPDGFDLQSQPTDTATSDILNTEAPLSKNESQS